MRKSIKTAGSIIGFLKDLLHKILILGQNTSKKQFFTNSDLMGGEQSICVFPKNFAEIKNCSENENENEKLFREQKFSPFSEQFFLENSAQNGLNVGEQFFQPNGVENVSSVSQSVQNIINDQKRIFDLNESHKGHLEKWR